MTNQELSLSHVQLGLLVINSQRNIREAGQYFYLVKRQRERFADVDSWVINTKRIDKVIFSDEIRQYICGGRAKDQE